MTTDTESPMTLPGSKRQLLQIQWLRGLAATMVMLYHTAAYRRIMFHDDSLLTYFGPSFGFFGVALFFAISGYLMSIAIRAQPPAVFLAHRIARIYPIYILATIVFYAIAEAFGQHFPYDDKALALMPVPKLWLYLRIEWTLIFELAFYVALYLIAAAGFARRIGQIAIGWLLLMIVCSVFTPDYGSRQLMPIYQMLTVSTCVPMAGGLLLPYAREFRVPTIFLLAGAILPWLLAAHFAQNYDASHWIFGISAVFVLWVMVSLPDEAWLLQPGLLGRTLARWGDYSYGLYLCHVAVIMLVYKELAKLPPWILALTAMSIAVAVAIGIGRCDLALYARFKRGLRSANKTRLRNAAWGYVAIYAAVSLYGAGQYFMRDRELRIDREIAAGIAEAGSVADAGSAAATANAAGMHPVSTLVGHLDMARWDVDSQRLFVDAWAYNALGRWHTVHVALFRDGKLVAVDAPSYVRKDVTAALGLHHRVKTGMHFEQPEPVCDPHPIVAIAFTFARDYRVLPGDPAPACPSP